MSQGELSTKAAIWLALVAYAIGAGTMLLAQSRARWLANARWVWTAGCVFFLVHIVCAFAFFHDWSHAAAYHETARQTGAMTGFQWGGGLFINYLFAIAWVADVLWWWLAPGSFARRSRWIVGLWHGFFFFMVFNGTIIFGSGPVRWLGAMIGLILGALWWRSRVAVRTPMR